MAKVSKEQSARLEGIGYAVRFLESGKTLEQLQIDAKMRGAYNIPLNVSKAELNDFVRRVQGSIIEGVILLACMALRTEFGFGKSRVEKFMQAMHDRSADMNRNFYDWDDLEYLVTKELGIERTN